MQHSLNFTTKKDVEFPDGPVPCGANVLLRQMEFHDDGVIIIVCEVKHGLGDSELSNWVFEPAGKRLVHVNDGDDYVVNDQKRAIIRVRRLQ